MEDVVVARLGASACLGEMALLYNTTRTATVTAASENAMAFRLTRAAYQVTLIDGGEDEDESGKAAAAGPSSSKSAGSSSSNRGKGPKGGGSSSESSSPKGQKRGARELRRFPWIHEQVRPMHRSKLISALSTVLPLRKGEPVLTSGRVGGVLLMILKGEVQFEGDSSKASREGGMWRASSNGELCGSAKLVAGDALALGRPGDEALLATLHMAATGDGAAGTASGGSGQLRLLGGTHHKCKAIALDDLEVLMIPMAELTSLAADSPAVLSNRSGIRALLQNTPWCHDVSRPELDALAFAFKPFEAVEGNVLIEQGKEAAALHLVVAGELKVAKRKPDGHDVLIFKAGPGDVLGERSIVSGAASMANVVCDAPSVTLCLTRDAYASTLPARMQPRMEKRRYASQLSSQGFESLSELQVVAVVGQGAFARVALARHKPTDVVYALKKIERAKVGEGHVRKQIMNERFVMGDVDHPFIARLHATFKTALSLFMVVEPCLGGELFTHMQKLDVLREVDARFYASCVASALEHLHTRHVVYRDLKPENVMISSTGYVKIIDFGFAKRLHLRTYTLCGTPEYLAPEMVMVRGHGKGVDWWALGVLLYEMVMGGAPHIIDPNSKKPQYDLPPNVLYKAILDKKFPFYFPSRLSRELCDVVRGLLRWDALNRLGCLTDGAKDVMGHPFFAAEDWDSLMAQTRPPPFVPKLASAVDTSHFDDAVPDGSFVNEPKYDYSTKEWDHDF